MIPARQFKIRPGGLYTAVQPYDQTDPIHRGALEGVLCDAVKHESKVHRAHFDPAEFRNVMRAMTTGDVETLFLVAAWDACKPKIIGASINFRSLFLQRMGKEVIASNGIYSEDVCVLPSKIRELVLERPAGRHFPEEGIGTHFIRECMRYFAENGMKGGIVPAGQRFEFAPNNTKIIKIQEQFGAILGADHNSGLLRLGEITDAILSKWTMPVELFGVLLVDERIDPHNFVVRWTDTNKRQKIDGGFMRGLSTFKGKPVTQGQFISNGDLPEPAMMECALASILKAANEEIRTRRWGRTNRQLAKRRSPSIPLLGDTRQIFSALLEAQNDYLLAPAVSTRENTIFGVKPPPMHIHALNEPEIVAGLYSLGAETHMLGHSASQTATLDLRQANGSESAVRPLKLIGSKAANDPQFSLVA